LPSKIYAADREAVALTEEVLIGHRPKNCSEEVPEMSGPASGSDLTIRR
jgi:hypothetical protein